MATVAGLTKKFHEGLERLFEDGVSQNVLTQIQCDALKAILQKEKASLKPLEDRDQDRSSAIAALQTNMPTNPAELAAIKANFEARHKSLVENLNAIQESQFNEFEQQLESLGIPSGIQQQILNHVRNAQQERIAGLEARAKVDEKCLENPARDRNMQLSAAMILGNLKIGAETDDKGNPKTPAGALVERWRAPLWPTIKKSIMGIEALGIAEKFTQWAKEDPDLFDEPGEVEAKFIKKGKFSPLSLSQDSKGKWGYKKSEGEDLAIMNPDHEGYSDWNLSVVKDYFEQESHTYKDVGAAGAFPYKLGLAPFNKMGSAGEFRISAGKIFPDKRSHLPGADHGLICHCEGVVRDDQKKVRIGIMAHEAMARGWKGVDLSVMPERWREEAYLACRRAGFTDEQITLKGGVIPDKWKEEGNKQRGRIEDAMKAKNAENGNVLSTVIPKLALQLQSPDANVRPERFFDEQRVASTGRLAVFSDAMVSASQRAAILADPAFGILGDIKDYVRSIVLLAEKVELINTLNTVNPDRARVAFTNAFDLVQPNNLPTSPDHKALFKALSVEAQASILSTNLDDALKQALLKELTVDQRISLLQQSNVSKEIAYDVLRSESEEGENQIKILVKLADSIPNLVQVLAGMTLVSSRVPPLPALPANAQEKRGPEATALALALLYDRLPLQKRDALFKALINDGAFSSKDRADIVEAVRYRSQARVTPMKPEPLVNAMSLENQVLYLRSIAAVPGQLTVDSLKAAGVQDSETQQKILELDTQLQNAGITFTGTLALLVLTNTQKTNLINFINNYVSSDPTALLGASIIRDLRPADQQAILLGIQSRTAAMLLQGSVVTPALSQTAMIAVRDNIVGNTTDNNAARKIFYELSDKTAIKSLLLQPNPHLGAQLHSLVINAVSPREKNKIWSIVTTVGAENVSRAFDAMQPAEQQAFKKFMLEKVCDPAIPVGEKLRRAKFLAQLIGISHCQLVAGGQNNPALYQFSNADAAVILAHVNDSRLIKAIMDANKLDPAGQLQARNLNDVIEILTHIADNAQKSKIFAGLTQGQQQQLFANNNLANFDNANRLVVFHRLADVDQTAHIRSVAQGLQGGTQQAQKTAANDVIAFLSSPGVSKERRMALWNDLQAAQHNDLLTKMTKTSTAFLVMLLEAAADKVAMFDQMVAGRLINPPPLSYLQTVAQALAASPSAGSVLSNLFINHLNDQVLNHGADVGAVESLRVNMLTQLVIQGHPEKARALFNAFPAGAEKDALKQAMVTAATHSPVQAALHKVVGYVPPAAPAPRGPGHP